MATKQKMGKTPKLSRSYRHKQSGKYARRFAITESNRRRRREKHLSLHPKDLQTLAALKAQLLAR